jgi:hypothetical protein
VDPSNEQALTTLALWQLYLGRVAEGRATLSNAYALNPGNATAERVLQALSAGETARTAPRHDKRVVLISDSPRVREAKLGRAILSQGWEVYLLSLSAESDAATENFTAVIHCADPWDAVIRAAELRPLVYHCLSQMKYETAAAFAAANPGAVLGDFYDQVDMLGEAMLAAEPIRNFDRTLERSVMARLDGHVCRSFESQLAARRENAVAPAPRIFFPDYGWGDIDPLPKLHEQDGELHVVYAGAMWVEKKFPHLSGDGGYLWLGELLTKHRVHMHVYPSSSSTADSDGTYDQYRELAAASPYFHLHDTVRDGRAFIREISQYDVGLTVYKSIVDGGIPQFYNKWKLALAASNKLADYVDANLRFMINPECCVHKLARHYGMAVAATSDLYDGAFWEGLKQQVLSSDLDQTAAKKYWDLGYNAPRLIRFYEQMGRRRA